MNFSEPVWLILGLLAVPVLWLAWHSRAPLPRWQLRCIGSLQVLALLAVVLALAGPWSRVAEGPLHTVVVYADPAAGDGLLAGQSQQAAERLRTLRAALPTGEPLSLVRAGAAPQVAIPGDFVLPEAAGAPDLTAALRAAALQVPVGARGQVLLYSHGGHDGEAIAAASNELLARQLPVHVRQLPAAPPAALQLRDVVHLPRVAAGEAFRIEATAVALTAGSARLELRSGPQLVATAELVLRAGEQRVAIDAVLREPGPQVLLLQLARGDQRDAVAAAERTAVLVDSGLSVLHLAADDSRRQAVAAALLPHGLRTVAPADPATLTAEHFDGIAAVLVDDLPASAWPETLQLALRAELLAAGTGLVLAGTHQNLGPGGYANSPLAEILPVRMPQREERRDPSVSLVLIVDTSGSMGGGRLELAKEVGRLAIQKLQPHDKVGMIEFHGSKRWAAPLQPASNTIEITRALNRLQVGGGTIIYDALEEAYFGLLNAQTRFQHVLVLTDGGVESGPFEALARRMAAAGQTVSTVLIGPLANSPFLQNLAQWGRGRFYACPDKFQLPDLQFREPQSSLLPAVQERRLPLQRTGLSEATAAFAGDQLLPSGGIVEASVRSGAEVLLRGSSGEPYLIGWDQGAGRALVLAGQVLGPQSGELRSDPAYGAFLADLLRSAASGALAQLPQLRLRTRERGLEVELQLPAGAGLMALPQVRLGAGPAQTLVPVGDRCSAWLSWPQPASDVASQLVVTVGDADGESVVLAAAAAVPPLPRSARLASVVADLQALALCTGGSFAATPELSLPPAPPRSQPQPQEHRGMLALLALLVWSLALLLRRLPLDRWLSRGTAGPRPAQAGPAAGGLAGALLVVAMALLATGASAQTVPQSTQQSPQQSPQQSAQKAAQKAAPAWPAADEAAVRAVVDEELRTRGDLQALATRWREAPALHRYWLARADGDLATAARLAAEPDLAARYPDAQWQLLDLLGRPREALAAFAAMTVPANEVPVAVAQRLLQRAILQIAVGDTAAARADLAVAVQRAAQPAFAQQAGVIAGNFGLHDLALAWHRVDAEPGRAAVQAALRRGLWQQRAGDLAAASLEYDLAQQRATTPRDRLFALAMRIAVHRAAGSLPDLAAALELRAAGQGAPLSPPEFQALAEVLRELGRAGDGLRLFAALPLAQQQELGELGLALAVDAGEPEQALQQLQRLLAERPDDAGVRCALAVQLADLQRDAEAQQVLRDGLPGARARTLRRLCATASELAMDDLVVAAARALDQLVATSGEGGDAIEGALLEVAHLRRQGNDRAALARVLELRTQVVRPQDRLRIAELLESLGRQPDAIGLYQQIWEETGTEDIGMRLAWLLGESKQASDRAAAQAIYRRVWTQAGSPARRVQAEEQVLDLAAREGNLADLALELETQVDAPTTENRPAAREALVKIYTRARDTAGAVSVLQRWAKAEPQQAVAALQQQARVHLAAEEFRAHERTLQRLLELDPDGELDYRQQLAMSALERGRPEDARRHIRSLLGKPGVPDSIAVEFGAGIYTLAAMHEESVRLYRRALALHPERVETFLLLGNALRAAGQREAALGTFQELLLRQLPDDLFVVAVDGLLNAEAPAPVLAAATRAVRLRLAQRPEQVFLHRVLQDLLEAAGDEPARMRALEDLLVAAGEQRASFVRELMQEADSRRDWASYANHGRVLLLLGDEVPPAVYLSLGEALLQLGQVDAAARAFARARLAGDFVAVERRVAEVYEGAGRLAEAERMRVRLLRRAPDEPQAMLAVARLAERQGAYARALPNWLRLARLLLPADLDQPKAPPTRAGLAMSRERAEVTFREPFAGLLRCADGPAALQPLLDDLRQAAAEGSSDRRLAALKHWRQLALAFPEAGLAGELRAAEDQLLAGPDAAVRNELRSRRLQAGDFAGVRAVPAGPEPTAEELRVLLLSGDRQQLAFAASKAKPGLLPELAQALLVAGRADEAQALLPLVAGSQAGGAGDELRRVLGLPVAAQENRAQQRLEQALARNTPLISKLVGVLAALRDLPDLPAGERRAHLQGLAEAVVAAKDAAAAERLLAGARSELEGETATALVELSFTNLDRAFSLPTRAQYLDLVPDARAVELVRTALRKWKDEERRRVVLQMLTNAQIPAAVQLDLVRDLDPRSITGIDRSIFLSGLDRVGGRAAVLLALAERFAATAGEDPLGAMLRLRATDDAATSRALALQALPGLAMRRSNEREDVLFAALAKAISADDARELLARAPALAGLPWRLALLQRVGDKEATAAAFLAAVRSKPDDTALLFRAANFFETEGMFERAAELFRTAQQQSSTFYPHQAQQLARLELQAGDAKAALRALQSAKDPSQINFRLLLHVLAKLDDAALRRAVLADALQQRASLTNASALSSLGILRMTGLAGGVIASDRLAAVLEPARLPSLSPATPAAAEQAPSDYDLLAFLPEGEAVARQVLRTLNDADRAADLGLYRGLLGAAHRNGRSAELIAAAERQLAQDGAAAEALRLLLAAAQLELALQPAAMARVLTHFALQAPGQPVLAISLLGIAVRNDAALAERLLRSLLQQRGGLADAQLRPWLPGLFAVASAELPALVLQLLAEPGLDSDVRAELMAAALLHHAEPVKVAAMLRALPAPEQPSDRRPRFLAESMPLVGASLLADDVPAALALLTSDGYWPAPRQLNSQRLAAMVPPLARWQRPEAVAEFAAGLLRQLPEATGERAMLLARVLALTAARWQDRDAVAASDLRSAVRRLAADRDFGWRLVDWLPE